MKNYIKRNVLLALMAISAISCGDILTEEPTSFLTPGTFPANEKDALAAVNAAYSRIYGSNFQFYYGSVTSDIAFQGYHNQRPSTYFVNLTGENGDVIDMWQNYYEGILRANTTIDMVPDVDMDVSIRNRIVAEAKFLRAYYYFDLVRIYGGVPLVVSAASDENNPEEVSRNTVAEVYTLIKQDLIDAAKDLPEIYSDIDAGRATKGAANALLTRVYLTLQEWDNANGTAKSVIESGVYGLVNDYNSLWDEQSDNQVLPDKNGNLVNEIVFARQYEQDLEGGRVGTWVGSRDVEIAGGGNGFGGGYENILPTPELKDLFEPGDLRADISYVEVLDGNVLVSPRTPGAGAITGKYLNRSSITKIINSGQNTPILRYSDVLLMRAEAENELNGPGGAYEFINLVRERAGIPDLSGLTKEGLRQAIRKERATELSLEGLRKYDLLRWGIFVETLRNSTSTFLEIPGANVQEFNVLMPIPQREIDIAKGGIVQNTGY